ncbi:BPSS1780 family membrane protein [Chromobacterium sp. ATCC 53434]|uniref:BPSS1780 family membrane protein n=1 Tax=Chromobacterium sp. (strain ATCC 53434 / SC 14030) TaxID=2059672 RepID=UPI0013051595|nr:BPSS1780 family membrane protein [Chromobacterium sp. ATCC 53434]
MNAIYARARSKPENLVQQLPAHRKVSATQGWRWFINALQIVRQQPLAWGAMTLFYLLILGALSVIPVFGDLVSALITPLFAAGFVLAADKSERGNKLELSDLFTAFGQIPGPLLLLGAMISGLMLILIVFAVAMGVSGALIGGLFGKALGTTASVTASGGGVVSLGVLALIGGVLVGMAYWFAPTLITLNCITPWQGLCLSLKACLSNWLPLLVVSLVLGVSCLVALLPLGLGLLLWIPVAFVTVYTGWRDVFAERQ